MAVDEWSERGPSFFEPREGVKGDVARAALYFAAVYESAADQAFLDRQRETLVAWDALDPASPEEVLRSGLIARYQGNVNPFVLDPTLARRALNGGVAAQEGPSGGLALSVYPNPAVGRATVSVALEAPVEVRVAIYDVLGRRVAVFHDGLLAGSAELVADISTLAPGAYVVRITGAGATASRTFSVVR